MGTAFFSVQNVPFFSVLLKNILFFSVLFFSFWWLMRPKRAFRSFEKNGCPTLLLTWKTLPNLHVRFHLRVVHKRFHYIYSYVLLYTKIMQDPRTVVRDFGVRTILLISFQFFDWALKIMYTFLIQDVRRKKTVRVLSAMTTLEK